MRRIYSHTRRSKLEKCARQYFYECYAASYEAPTQIPQLELFRDIDPDHAVIASDVVGQVGRLKELSSAYQAAGLILHSLIGEHWKHADWSSDWFLQQASQRFDAWVSRSRGDGTSGPVLLECYYRLADADETIAEAKHRLLRALTTYFADESIRVFVGELQRSDEVYTEQSIGGLPNVRGFTIMGRIDVAVRTKSSVRVVDWKMGSCVGDEDSLQLTLYGWWATQKFGISPDSVVVQRVFLGDGTIERGVRMNERMLDRGRARLKQDVERMEGLHDYGVKGFWGAFPVCDKEKVCHQCKFQGVCPAVASATA